MTHDQLQQLTQAIQDRYGFIAAQIQSDYTPDYQQLERWKRLGLVPDYITPETFASSVPAEMHMIRNAFIIGRLADAVERGTSFEQAMKLALALPLKKPDLDAIAVAEQQTAMYLTDNAQDLATKVGQLAIEKRNEQIRQMAIDYHARKQKRTVLDEDLKREAGEEIPERYVENWQQFKSELYHTLDEKDRDLDRVAYYEITDAQKQGQAAQLMADGNVDKYVYKRPMPTACAQCKYLYLMPDGVTPRLFKLSEMISNGTNVGRKPHPTKGGKVVHGGRADGQETLKAVAGLVHPWCACMGPYTATGYERWITPEQKEQIKKHKESMEKSHDVSGEGRNRLGKWTADGTISDKHADNFRYELQLFFSGSLPAERRVLLVAQPSRKLREAGITGEDITIKTSILRRKSSKDADHAYDYETLQDLPEAINNPIMVFEHPNGNKDIITSMIINNKNVLVGLETIKTGKTTEVQRIATLFGKKSESLMDWIRHGRKFWYDKEKAQQWLSLRQGTNTPEYPTTIEPSDNSIPFFEDSSNNKLIKALVGYHYQELLKKANQNRSPTS